MLVILLVSAGSVCGPFIAIAAALTFETAWASFESNPGTWLVHGVLMGMIYALSFWVFVGSFSGVFAHRRHVRIVIVSAFVLPGFAAGVIALGSPSVYGSIGRLLLFAAIAAVAHAQYLSLEKRTKQAEVYFARLRALQAQINPHFFFNTLNTISALIPADPDGAQRTVGLLADMSRHAFAATDKALVPLAQELQFARDYLEIERLRFGDRLKVEMPDSAGAEGIELPALTLQPLIENAIRHGIAKLIDGGAISVRVRRNEKRFFLVVENDTESVVNLYEAGFFLRGHALDNIRQRLAVAYTYDAGVHVALSGPDRVTVTIEGPLKHDSSADRR